MEQIIKDDNEVKKKAKVAKMKAEKARSVSESSIEEG